MARVRDESRGSTRLQVVNAALPQHKQPMFVERFDRPVGRCHGHHALGLLNDAALMDLIVGEWTVRDALSTQLYTRS